ncbi:MAG TPA: molybdopterin-dependent oxidoreductase [Blastocatellia bacterium]|nr:molybdopterin-dependent oxidoreductase [Blastocatellia bacterium]
MLIARDTSKGRQKAIGRRVGKLMDILRLNIDQTEPKAASDAELRFQIALLASLASVVVSFAARFILDAPLIPEMMAQFVFAVAPIWIVEAVVGLLGPFGKHLGFLACVIVYGIGLISATLAFLRYFNPTGSIADQARIAAFSLALWFLSAFVVVPVLGGGLMGSRSRQGVLATSLSLLAAFIAYGIALSILEGFYIGSAERRAKNNVVSRRRVIRGVWYAVVAVGVWDIGRQLFGSWFFSGGGRVHRGDGLFPNIDNLALEVTPNADFYQVSKNAFDPQVDPQAWKLEVGGLVENTFELTYNELREMPFVEQYATLVCISNEVGGDLIGTALWRGVKLKDILERAGVKSGVVDILLRARDDYADSIPLDRATADGTLLVYEMNGGSLTPEHGFPLRLLVPGIYGMKNVKWITKIEAVDFDFKGYWQRRGWDDRAENKTMSRIDAPDSQVKSETSIAGIAFAGDRGISKVEVSTDGGSTWDQAEIKPSLSPYTWALWHKRWTPAQPGKHKLLVRATDGRGQTQTSQYAPPAPSGSSGLDSKVVSSA